MSEEPGETYRLGVDLGTTFTAAAVYVADAVEVVDLGNRATQMPSVVFLAEDGNFVTGEAAERRGQTEPGRVAREFKRRIGDPTPIMLGGVPCSADMLMGELLRSVVRAVTDRYRTAPSSIALSHPATWGPYKLDLLQQAARMADCGDVTLISEPEAAVLDYCSAERVEPGSIIAVYDFGGGTFDAAVVRKRLDGTELLGQPDGTDRLGGADFDQDVLSIVMSQLDDGAAELDHNEELVRSSLWRLRDECRDAKEGLSTVDNVSVPVMLPGIQATATVGRAEFDEAIRPALDQTLIALRRALTSAQVEPEDVYAVLLAGGSSRIPLVQQMVAEGLGRPVALDAHPKYLVASGAVRSLGPEELRADAPALNDTVEASATELPPPPPVPDPPVTVFERASEPVVEVEAGSTPETTVFETAPEVDVDRPVPSVPAPLPVVGPESERRVPWPLIALAALLLAGVVGAFLILPGGDDGGPDELVADVPGETDPDETDSDTSGQDPTAPPEGSLTAEPTAEALDLPVPLRTIVVGSEPHTPLFFDESVWVPNAGVDTISRIDPATGDITEVTVGARPDAGIDAAGLVWVPVRESESLARIDPADGSVTTTQVGPNPDTPVFDGEFLWLAVRDANKLLAIEPSDGSVVLTIDLGGRPLTPIVVDRSLWFVTRDDNSVHRIDLAALELPNVPALDTIQVGADPDRPILAGGVIWVPNRDEQSMSVIDPSTLQVLATVAVGDRPDTPVEAGGRVWVPNAGSTTVSVIDIATFEVVATIEVGDGPRSGVATEDSVWIPASKANVIVQLDIESLELVDRFLTGAGPATPALIGDSLWIPNRESGTILELQVS